MAVGYSATPPVQKQGVKKAARLALLGAPHGLDAQLAHLPDGGVTVLRRLAPNLEVAELFVTERRAVERRFSALAEAVIPAGGFWVAWPKRASKEPTDLTESVVREVGLPHSLVDSKACTITDGWSGHRLVWRNDNRA